MASTEELMVAVGMAPVVRWRMAAVASVPAAAVGMAPVVRWRMVAAASVPAAADTAPVIMPALYPVVTEVPVALVPMPVIVPAAHGCHTMKEHRGRMETLRVILEPTLEIILGRKICEGGQR
ncbi:hypothetical protein FACS1894124_5650 [Spirochaetia bacterium]|nr:hypothetical protein FACS1894124_5650 [Spirochaetia bacterium]